MPQTLDDLPCPPYNWCGYLDLENAWHIHRWLCVLLGGKEYMVFSVNCASDPPHIETRKGHLIADWTDHSSELIKVSMDMNSVHINFSGTDGYYYSFWSYEENKELGEKLDPTKNTYVKFDHGKVTFTGRAGAGQYCVTHFVPIGIAQTGSWTWYESQEAWLVGTRNDGAGVYEQKGKWYGNIVHPVQYMLVGPCDTKEEAQAECMEWLAEARRIASKKSD